MNSGFELQSASVPIECLEEYYGVSANCLLKKYTTVQLPLQLDGLLRAFQATTFDKSHFQLKWRELFTTYDLPDNAKLECYGPSFGAFEILMPIPLINKITREKTAQGNKPILTKIIQFYHDECTFGYSCNNPAIVAYYYDGMSLCKFDVYYEFVQSLDEVNDLAEKYNASQYEKEQLIGYWLKGKDIYSNPEDIRDFSDKPYDFLDFLRDEPLYFEAPPEMGTAAVPGNAGRPSPTPLDDDDDVLPF